VQEVLTACSQHYSTTQNIECFTNFCRQNNIHADALNKQSSECFNKEVSQLVSNRSTFNVLELISKHFASNTAIANDNIGPWNADTYGKRGHDKIGEGEIFFSFFCNGTKGKKGDVCFERVVPLKIEFKGHKGRLLTSREISLCTEFKTLFYTQPQNIHTMAVTLCVLAGAIYSSDGINMLNGGSTTTSLYTDVCNAITASNALGEFDLLSARLSSRWSTKAKNSALRAICGAIQLSLYKKESGFDWLILTKKETPYICKGFQISDNIVANTLTILNNNVTIHQNLDGKGYHISF